MFLKSACYEIFSWRNALYCSMKSKGVLCNNKNKIIFSNYLLRNDKLYTKIKLTLTK